MNNDDVVSAITALSDRIRDSNTGVMDRLCRIEDHLDRLNTRTAKSEVAIAVVSERIDNHRRHTNVAAAKWGAGAAAAITGALTAIWEFLVR